MDECLDLPPGFRFHPTDEEIIAHYLSPKIVSRSFATRAIGEVDLNKCEPWDLPSKAKMGEKEWYFFCQRDRKYPTGTRTNRATECGYWKATGKDKEIFTRGKKILVGMKKTLVFYGGRAPKGEKTNWVMHEYRIESNLHLPRPLLKDEWVVCRVFHKNSGAKKTTLIGTGSFGDLMMDSPSLPPLADYYIDQGSFEFKGTMDNHNFSSTSTSMMGMGMGMGENGEFSTNFSIPLEDPYSELAYLHRGAIRQCKVEQFAADHSTVRSEDTETSSVVSRRNDIEGCYDGDDVQKSMGLDLENMWKC